MKKYYCEGCREDVAALEEKFDLLLELIENVLDNPDFLIDRLRRSAERQYQNSIGPKMKIIRCHESE